MTSVMVAEFSCCYVCIFGSFNSLCQILHTLQVIIRFITALLLTCLLPVSADGLSVQFTLQMLSGQTLSNYAYKDDIYQMNRSL